MPERRLPASTPAILRTLRRARNAYLNVADPAERAISSEQFALLDPSAVPPSLLKRFEKEVSDIDLALALQAPLTTALSSAAARTAMLVSHFHQVYDFGVARGTFTAGGRAFYGRDPGVASLPPLVRQTEIEEAATAVVDGEIARATAEGAAHEAMARPAAPEVETALEALRAAMVSSERAVARTNREREEANALYAEAQALAVDICDTAEFFFRKDRNDSSRRVKCKRWGVVYIYGPSEPADPEPPEDPEPPAPPNP